MKRKQHEQKIHHHRLWEVFFFKGTTSVPLNTVAFSPPLYFCSFHYCASCLKCLSHGQRLSQTQLFVSSLTESQRETMCSYSNLSDCAYICICCTFVRECTRLYQGVLRLSAVNHVLSHTSRLRNLKDRGKLFWHIFKTWLPS